MIIVRYLHKEVAFTMIAITFGVVFIFICNLFVHYLTYVTSGKYALSILFHLVFLQVPILISLLLPLGLFLGILVAYGRLYAESEMTVLKACGMSELQLMGHTLFFGIGVMFIVAALTLILNPIFYIKRDQLMDVAESSTLWDTITPGRFQSSSDGNSVFYVKKMDRDRGKMHDIFIAQQLRAKTVGGKIQPTAWIVISAKEAYQQPDRETGDPFIVAKNGYRYEGIPGQRDFSITQYKTYGKRASEFSTPTTSDAGMEVISTARLWTLASQDNEAQAELQWRMASPLSVLLLTLLAVPFSRVNPRQGRFAQLVPAILLYILYANMMFVARNWLEDGRIPAWLGIWWTHALVLCLVGGLFLYRFMKRSG